MNKKIKIPKDSKAINYKTTDLIREFISDRGKIIPQRITKSTRKKHKLIEKAIKQARLIGLMPFKQKNW
uniref:Small ribosomal subunit protein bS18c n=1 Tax=Cyanidium caldarium TaxID=2771 RepID=RR18_CYACA|nr:ribosomal protein S18 [Cyanidium caldarium]Q9TM39.1 RecName: Full=Small ribosomal subunit protein bS18c; AltName: Full=30S ribosomal protein S18, chloroplastic [Cyanidium caldarium]AAF13018.1 unknown [Cyanidium caldarium]WDB00154.1 ribosomal protein S18 [Cyanidium caldarium]